MSMLGASLAASGNTGSRPEPVGTQIAGLSYTQDQDLFKARYRHFCEDHCNVFSDFALIHFHHPLRLRLVHVDTRA